MNAFKENSDQCVSDKLIGVVLAGGLSSRMGHDKANIALHNENGLNLLGKTIELLASLGLEVWVSGRAPASKPTLAASEKAQENTPACFYFEDQVKGLGPLGGIATALELAAGRPCLVLSCDLPFMDRPTLEQLIMRREKRAPETLLTIYVQAETGYQESLTAIYEADSLPLLKNCVDNRLLKLNRIVPVEKQERIIYTAEQALPFFNVNYPADLEAARRILRSL